MRHKSPFPSSRIQPRQPDCHRERWQPGCSSCHKTKPGSRDREQAWLLSPTRETDSLQVELLPTREPKETRERQSTSRAFACESPGEVESHYTVGKKREQGIVHFLRESKHPVAQSLPRAWTV